MSLLSGAKLGPGAGQNVRRPADRRRHDARHLPDEARFRAHPVQAVFSGVGAQLAGIAASSDDRRRRAGRPAGGRAAGRRRARGRRAAVAGRRTRLPLGHGRRQAARRRVREGRRRLRRQPRRRCHGNTRCVSHIKYYRDQRDGHHSRLHRG